MPTAAGSFEVKMSPQPADERPAAAAVGRMLLDKTFAGDLVATSAGQMLAYRSAVAGSAGYVAIEHVTGTLAGRTGSFVLQHDGAMARGAASLTVRVVADSGTEQLVGLSGTMTIDASGGAHRYTFTYELA